MSWYSLSMHDLVNRRPMMRLKGGGTDLCRK